MIFDGRTCAQEIQNRLHRAFNTYRGELLVHVVSVGDSKVSRDYMRRKKEVGESIGVSLVCDSFGDSISEEALADVLRKKALDPHIHGLVLQLPVPDSWSTEALVKEIPPDKDIDALGVAPRVYPPVVEAIREIFKREGLHAQGKKAVVIGRGRLVGVPVFEWLTKEGARVKSFDRSQEGLQEALSEAEIIVSGAGSPGLITPDLLPSNGKVILLDAGTSEASGKIVGDADPQCAQKCALFTPVPGGIGPMTLVMLFRNLAFLQRIPFDF